MKKAVLVTGAGGFIGANLVRGLVKKKYSVHCILRPNTDYWRLDKLRKQIHIHHVLLCDKKRLNLLMRSVCPRTVFHLASYGNNSQHEDINEMIETNVKATFNLLESLNDSPSTHFINVGSSSEYGDTDIPMHEDMVCQPSSFYGATKLAGTAICNVFARSKKHHIVTVRPFSVYGPYEHAKRFIPTIIRALIYGKPITLTPAKSRHDFIYIDDLVSLLMTIDAHVARANHSVYNAGTGCEYTNDEVVLKLFNVTGKEVPVQKGAFKNRSWDVPHWVSDISRTKNEFSWVPSHTLENGLLKTYAWTKEHNLLYETGD